MKKLIFIICLLLISAEIFAQSSTKVKYQEVNVDTLKRNRKAGAGDVVVHAPLKVDSVATFSDTIKAVNAIGSGISHFFETQADTFSGNGSGLQNHAIFRKGINICNNWQPASQGGKAYITLQNRYTDDSTFYAVIGQSIPPSYDFMLQKEKWDGNDNKYMQFYRFNGSDNSTHFNYNVTSKNDAKFMTYGNVSVDTGKFSILDGSSDTPDSMFYVKGGGHFTGGLKVNNDFLNYGHLTTKTIYDNEVLSVDSADGLIFNNGLFQVNWDGSSAFQKGVEINYSADGEANDSALTVHRGGHFTGGLKVNGHIDALNMGLSAGVYTMPAMTDNSDSTYTVADVVCMLYPDTAGEGVLHRYTVSGATFKPDNNANNYCIVDYNGGSPLVRNMAYLDSINWTTKIPIAFVYRINAAIDFLKLDELAKALPNKLQIHLIAEHGFCRATGLTLSEEATRKINISAGDYVYGGYKASLPIFETGEVGNTLREWVYDGSIWVPTVVTQYDNTSYQGATGKTASGGSHYLVLWVYRKMSTIDPLGKVAGYIFGTTDYVKLTDAQNSAIPANIPPIFSTFGYLVGRIIIQYGASSAVQIEQSYASVFSGSPVAYHNELSGLDVVPYQHVTDTNRIAYKEKSNVFTATQYIQSGTSSAINNYLLSTTGSAYYSIATNYGVWNRVWDMGVQFSGSPDKLGWYYNSNRHFVLDTMTRAAFSDQIYTTTKLGIKNGLFANALEVYNSNSVQIAGIDSSGSPAFGAAVSSTALILGKNIKSKTNLLQLQNSAGVDRLLVTNNGGTTVTLDSTAYEYLYVFSPVRTTYSGRSQIRFQEANGSGTATSYGFIAATKISTTTGAGYMYLGVKLPSVPTLQQMITCHGSNKNVTLGNSGTVVSSTYTAGIKSFSDKAGIWVLERSWTATPVWSADSAGNTNQSGDLTYNFMHAVGSADSVNYTPSVTQWNYTKLEPGLTWHEADGITCAGDSMRIQVAGDYVVQFSITSSGANQNDFWRVKIFKNNESFPSSVGRFRWKTTTAGQTDTKNYFWYITVAANDYISFKITNETAARNPTITDMKVYIEKKPEN
jgi:hypothetical protein